MAWCIIGDYWPPPPYVILNDVAVDSPPPPSSRSHVFYLFHLINDSDSLFYHNWSSIVLVCWKCQVAKGGSIYGKSICENSERYTWNRDTCMYVDYIDSPKGCKFFWKVLSFCTHYTLSVPPYQPLSTGSGSILGCGATRASPGISIERTAIVVVRTPYIWSYFTRVKKTSLGKSLVVL